jgi:succinyl-diaminopimelate desuccinylase
MSAARDELLAAIERDRDKLVAFLRDLIRAASPNPPGDTRQAAAHAMAFLKSQGLEPRVIAPDPEMPNLLASFEGTGPGRHLVLNGHMDVFPAADDGSWRHGPWSGALEDGHIWGRGAVDMKAGTTASLFAFAYLRRLRDRFPGKLTLTVVSDEETFGPCGMRYLMEHHPEVHGDCCLSGEPSDPTIIRFGEKGPLWLRFTVRTPGAHGAYPHLSESAIAIAARLIGDLKKVTTMKPPLPGNLTALLDRSAPAVESAFGQGAARVVGEVTFHPGIIAGGLKVNMIAADCSFEADFRLPVGADKEWLLKEIRTLAAAYPEASFEEIQYSAPNWCDPEHAMAQALKTNAKALRGEEPQLAIGLGGTDTRLWRYRGIPAFVYGPSPKTMGQSDERIAIDEFLHIVRTHALSAFDYLSGVQGSQT